VLPRQAHGSEFTNFIVLSRISSGYTLKVSHTHCWYTLTEYTRARETRPLDFRRVMIEVWSWLQHRRRK